eukprot:12460899-Alexandrium_andersonii.AAC.1
MAGAFHGRAAVLARGGQRGRARVPVRGACAVWRGAEQGRAGSGTYPVGQLGPGTVAPPRSQVQQRRAGPG